MYMFWGAFGLLLLCRCGGAKHCEGWGSEASSDEVCRLHGRVATGSQTYLMVGTRTVSCLEWDGALRNSLILHFLGCFLALGLTLISGTTLCIELTLVHLCSTRPVISSIRLSFIGGWVFYSFVLQEARLGQLLFEFRKWEACGWWVSTDWFRHKKQRRGILSNFELNSLHGYIDLFY